MRSALVCLMLVACSGPPAPPAASTPPVEPALVAVDPLPPPPAAKPVRIAVTDDAPASIVRGFGEDSLHTVFLPGICSNAFAYLHYFPEAARRQGGVLAIEGDQPCGPGAHSFSWDAGKQHARIEAAFAAANAKIPDEGLTIVGYSQGASIAEQLVQRWPGRYTRVVLIGAPTDPSPSHFLTTRGVVTMSCDRDVPLRMKEASRGIARKGIPSTYVQMPGCSHGWIGDGENTFGAAFEFLGASAR